MSIISSEAHSSKSESLETLVRIALINRELAPGVAKQINSYRSENLSAYQQRLLAILDDAIADQCIIVIQPIGQPLNQPLPQPVAQPATSQPEHFVLCCSIPNL